MPATIIAPIQGDDVALTTSATSVYVASDHASASEPEKIVVQNLDASIVITVGGSDVANGSNGVVLGSQYDSVTLHLRTPGSTVYAVAASGTPSVSVTRVG